MDLFFPRNSKALIGDSEDENAGVEGVCGEADGDCLKLWCIFHRVHKEMQHDLLQSLLVGAHTPRHVRALLQVDDDLLAVGVEVDEVEDFLEEDVDIEGLLLQRELVGLDAEVVLPLETLSTSTFRTKLWIKRPLVKAASR